MVNILDQHFTVQLKALPPPGKDIERDDDDEMNTGTEFEEPASSEDIVQPSTEKLSIFLFSAAIYDSKRLIDKDIRNRQAQITERRLQAAAMKTKQDQVDIRASSIKPSDATRMLGDRFRQQEELLAQQNSRLTALEDSQVKLGNSTTKASTAVSSETMSVDASAGIEGDNKFSALLRDHELLLRRMALLELQIADSKPAQISNAFTTAAASSTPASAPKNAPKNDARANDQAPSNRALKRARQAARAAAAQTMTPANPQPTPPSFSGRNGNGNARTQQRNQTSTTGGQESSHDTAARQNGQQQTGNTRRRGGPGRQKGGDGAQA